jgi:hypothetical protein
MDRAEAALKLKKGTFETQARLSLLASYGTAGLAQA